MSETAVVGTLLDRVRSARILMERPDEEYDLRKALKSLYPIYEYESRPVDTYDCGSVRLESTVNSLYRALFLFEPKQISFTRMYKGELLALSTPDCRLVASVEFYKYELAVYFSAAREYVHGRCSSIICGLPGSNNGVDYVGDLPGEWFSLLVNCLNKKWMVYGGNDFEV